MMTAGTRLSPFRSLDFFTRADSAVFAGREDEIEEVATRILSGDTLVVYGPSGVGKTSLLCAGVVPALEKRRGYRVTYVRPLLSPRGDVWGAVGADPAEPLAAALTRLSAYAADDAIHVPVAESLTLSDPAIQITPDRRSARTRAICAPHVLILDQLEELFTRFDEPQRRPLWDGLVEVLDSPDAPVRLVLSLREEYLHFLDSAHPRLPNLLDRRFRLRGLAPFGARTAMVRPLIAQRTRYEPELVDRCVADLTEVPTGHAEEDGVVDPLLLQIVCSEVYRGAAQRNTGTGTPSLTLAGYTELGGPAGVFRRHLEELFHRVEAGDHLLLQLVLQEMTTAHATKLPTTISRLARSGLAVPATELQGILDKLVAASLVRRYAAEPEPWYELVHDRLVQALPDHFARDQKFLRLRYMRELVSQLSKGFSEGMIGAPLLNRQQLADLVEPFRRYIRFNEQELGLLFRSAVAIEHNVAQWRDAFEAAAPGSAPEILLDLLYNTETQRGAVAAVAVLRITEPAILAHTLRLALHGSDQLVAGAAARALSTVAGDNEAAELMRALKDRVTRPRALWVLEQLTGNPAFQAAIPLRELSRATRAHEQRQLVQAKEKIQRGGWEGLRIGIGTGAVASLGAIASWCIAATWTGPQSGVVYGAGAAVIAALSMMLSLIGGHSVGRAMAKLRELGRTPTWTLAMRDRSLLGTLGIAFVVAVMATAFVFVAAAEPLAIPELDSTVRIVLGAAIALPLAGATIVYSVGLTEWTMPRGLWHRTRTPIFVAVRTFSISWSLTIGIGYLLVSIGSNLGPGVNAIAVGAALFGTWCSVCAMAIAGVFAESIWRRSRSRRVVPRRWVGSAPIAVLAAAIIALQWRSPLPFWAPVVDVTLHKPTQLEREWPRALPTTWTYGRWLRIRNRSSDVRIVSFNSPASSPDRDELLLLWPGTYTEWFPPSVVDLYSPYRQIDLAHEAAAPGTFAMVALDPAEAPAWSKLQELGPDAPRLLVRQVGCRAIRSDHVATCYGNRRKATSCDLDGTSPTVLIREDAPSTAVMLKCRSALADDHVVRVEAVVVFDPITYGPSR